MKNNFASNFLSQDSIEQDYRSKNTKKSVLGVFYCTKISISVLNFSTESAKKPTVYDLPFLFAIYSARNDNKHFSEVKNKHYRNHFIINEIFPRLEPILMTYRKCWPTVTFLQIFLFTYKLSYKNKSQSSIDSNWFVFKEAPTYKEGFYKLSEFNDNYASWYRESSFFCIYHFWKW